MVLEVIWRVSSICFIIFRLIRKIVTREYLRVKYIVSLALIVQLCTAHVFNIIAIFPHNKYRYTYKKDVCIKNETEISLIYIYFIPVICIRGQVNKFLVKLYGLRLLLVHPVKSIVLTVPLSRVWSNRSMFHISTVMNRRIIWCDYVETSPNIIDFEIIIRFALMIHNEQMRHPSCR